MVTKQLLDYIKEQRAAGVSREKIDSSLIEAGWTTGLISEAFQIFNYPVVSRYSNKDSSIDSGLPAQNNISQESYSAENRYWSKYIPLTNKIFMGISLIIMFVINIYILATDALEIGIDFGSFFYAIMLVPLIIFACFYQYENKKLSVDFGHTQSRTDPWILALIIIRNIVFILNFIPFIQIGGALALGFGVIPYLIIYFLLIHARGRAVRA